MNGCPDSDGDKVPDIYDVCPDVAGDPALGGCPDSDNDGVVDSQDPCPNTYGTINGCTQQAIEAMMPESEKSIKVQLIEAAEDVLFELDKATLTAGSYDALDDILKVLQNNPDMKIDINGHADSTGSEDYNYQLSKKRAETVRNYFIEKGIASNRLMAEGFGERAPRTGNSTSGERALNRRVDIDFIINNN
jgi:outer membrane protein OmpA-like peptidoglycan-associated protein